MRKEGLDEDEREVRAGRFYMTGRQACSTPAHITHGDPPPGHSSIDFFHISLVLFFPTVGTQRQITTLEVLGHRKEAHVANFWTSFLRL